MRGITYIPVNPKRIVSYDLSVCRNILIELDALGSAVKVVENEYGYNYSDTEAVEKWRELYDKAMTPTLERIFN